LSDSETARLGELLRQLVSEWNIGIMLVEHNIDMVLSCCDRITVLAEGSILTSGSPAEVRNDERVLEAYLGKAAELDGAKQVSGYDIVRTIT
jgi:sulfate-transporting ATPase